jgi:hypothetical protein
MVHISEVSSELYCQIYYNHRDTLHSMSTTNLSSQRSIISLVVLLLFAGGIIYANSHLAYAVIQNTYVTKFTIEKHTIKRGQTQTLDAQVNSKSGVAVTGTKVTFTVNYADLKTTRQATVAVDASGHASYSWQIGDNVKPGSFTVTVDIEGPGFEPQSIAGQNFIVQKGHHND